jgi:RNA polymerase sigma factor (sigma-70 family)
MANSIMDRPEQDPPPGKARRVVVQFPHSTAHPDGPDTDIGKRLREVFRADRVNLIRFLVIRLGSEADAQDCAQDAMFRLFQRQGTLRDTDLRSLLYVTARNIAIDRLRERRRAPLSLSGDAAEAAHEVADESVCPERSAAAREQLARMRVLLQELPPKCRQAFISYKFEGMEYAEIAARMELTESMVRKYVLRALAYCAARFDGGEGEQ